MPRTCFVSVVSFSTFYPKILKLSGLPFIRVMPRVTAVAGSNLIIKCPVAGYPIESVIWEQGKFFSMFIFLFFILQGIHKATIEQAIVIVRNKYARKKITGVSMASKI